MANGLNKSLINTMTDALINNESSAIGGFDFSDAAEIDMIIAVEDVPDVSTFSNKVFTFIMAA